MAYGTKLEAKYHLSTGVLFWLKYLKCDMMIPIYFSFPHLFIYSLPTLFLRKSKASPEIFGAD